MTSLSAISLSKRLNQGFTGKVRETNGIIEKKSQKNSILLSTFLLSVKALFSQEWGLLAQI